LHEPTWPIFASRGHRQRLPLHLRATADGWPVAFVYTLPPNATLGLLSRAILPDGGRAASLPSQPSRLRDMVQRVYPAAEVEGSVADRDLNAAFGSVVVIPRR